ncbi:hypothetical protein LUZ63_014974 [Rhynchospora breviuscula]|uniref:Uncharacterized protein n=1 Tax=Rhynchospora breviuscula TaxID=2022672 RepID=A0A9Q0CBD1_9POAL|nr:hypothetical protein LUZ63_014974 [Rhynchospora breviuscula]
MMSSSVLPMNSTNFFCKISAPQPNGRKQATHSTISSYSFRKLRSWRRFAFSRGRNLQISARLGPPIRRQNTLRRKITTKKEHKVTDYSHMCNSDPNFEDPESVHVGTDKNGSSLDTVIEEVSSLDSVNQSVVYEDSKPELKHFSNYPNFWSELENWASQHKMEPVTKIYEDSENKIISMALNGEEVYRCKVRKVSAEDSEAVDETTDLNSNFTPAKEIGEGTEKENFTVPERSLIDNTVSEEKKSPFMDMVHSISRMKIRMPIRADYHFIGRTLLITLCISWVVTWVISMKKRGKRLKEVEMLKRKKANRMKREEMEKGTVEVLDSVPESPSISVERPPFDRDKLMEDISQANVITSNSVKDRLSVDLSSVDPSGDKVRKIREMVRKVHEFEGQNSSQKSEGSERGKGIERDGRNDLYKYQKEANNLDSGRKEAFEGNSNHGKMNNRGPDRSNVDINQEINLHKDQVVEKKSDPRKEKAEEMQKHNLNSLKGKVKQQVDRNQKNNDKKQLNGVAMPLNGSAKGVNTKHSKTKASVPKEEIPKTSGTKSSGKTKPRIIKSVQEAKDYLAKKQNLSPGKEKQKLKSSTKYEHDSRIESEIKADDKNPLDLLSSLVNVETSDSRPVLNNRSMKGLYGNSSISITSENGNLKGLNGNSNVDSGKSSVSSNSNTTLQEDDNILGDPQYLGNQKEPQSGNDPSSSSSKVQDESKQEETKQNWTDKYEEELSPVISIISKGFKENFAKAREQPKDITLRDLHELVSKNCELDWLKDEKLSEIVFKVRDNELTGKDPFHNLDEGEKRAFVEGLEKKIERANEKLLPLHQYLHSKIENLDYGADGISVYDPVEKMIPRWKGPAFEKDLAFLDKPLQQKKTSSDKTVGEAKDLTKSKGTSSYSPIVREKSSSDKNKTVIESSDGTNRPGKKSGKEQWQHTKKWSQGFLDVYNSETDPEIKSVLKDMGKDLDRWITEEELQQKRSLKEKMFQKRRKFVEKKMEKLKSEVEKYGAAAVVNKYREYADTKEEDYLWWLDLPYVLCIELYMMEEGSPRVGLYALEMAADLELNPKQNHVIGFQDSRDAKNFCYIIQTQMEIMGAGNAFVVARPPKDAFREAKAEGFNVTVIKKGEIKLNIDQTLDEVEDKIIEIGSKMYHDMIMHERSVDVGTIMKGLVRAEKSAKQ